MQRSTLLLIALLAPALQTSGFAAVNFTAYDCWSHLGFEDATEVSIDHWSASGNAVTFPKDSTQAHAGKGYLMLSGASNASVWGGRGPGSYFPEAGQTIAGRFWIKLLEKPSTGAGVDVRMTGFRDGTETVYCHTAKVDLSTLPLNTWTQIEIVSAGNTFIAGSDANFNILSDGGVRCLIDDITFGAQTAASGEAASIEGQRLVKADDPAFTYMGRWTSEGSNRHGNWIRPYFKLAFKGSSSVTIALAKPSGLTVVLDGKKSDYRPTDGPLQVGRDLAPATLHTLWVSAHSWQDDLILSGVYLDPAAVLEKSPLSKRHIEFIGDSITAADGGYAWQVPQRLGADSTRIAWPGIALQDDAGYCQLPAGVERYGMISAWLMQAMPLNGKSAEWDFVRAAPQPDIVVINLGTNDFAAIRGNAARVDGFQTDFEKFLKQVRDRRPYAQIYVLRPFSIDAEDVQMAIRRAAEKTSSSGDLRIYYVDTSDWRIDISPDGIHPTDKGHIQATTRLIELLKRWF